MKSYPEFEKMMSLYNLPDKQERDRLLDAFWQAVLDKLIALREAYA